MTQVAKCLILPLLMVIPIVMLVNTAAAQGVTSAVGADIVSRYNWRGLDFGDAVSLQPSLEFQLGNLQFGFWGSYSSDFEEVDTWAGYTIHLGRSGSLTATIVDYYFPTAGIRVFNFNNYDNPDGAGAHLLETGLSYTGPTQLPLTLSGYVNIYNDAGNNTYFQLDYPFTVKDIDMGIFIGGTGGSSENPGYYGTDDAQIINVGVKGTKKMKFSAELELPVAATFILNPCQEVAHLVLTVSI